MARPNFHTLAILSIILVSAACTPQSSPVASTAPPETETAAKTASSQQASENKTITVLAAASLIEPFTELGKLFEAQNPGVRVVFSFAGSQQLAQQLEQGVPADVFASASQKYMDAAVASGRVAQGAAQIFANNRLVVIVPKDNPAGIKTLKDLAKPGIKLDLAASAVPAGLYTLEFLDKAAEDPAFGSTFKDDVLKNIVSYEENVKAVLTKVILGEADAGIVYLSDISQEASGKVDKLEIPDALNVVAAYPIAAVSDRLNPDLAGAFIDLVLSPAGQKVLIKYNFLTPK